MAKKVAKNSKTIIDKDISMRSQRIYYCPFCKNLFVNEFNSETHSHNDVKHKYQCLYCQEHIEAPFKNDIRKVAMKNITYHIQGIEQNKGIERNKASSNQAEQFIRTSINELFELGYSCNNIHLITRFSIQEIQRITKSMFGTISKSIKLDSYIPSSFLNKGIVLKELPYSSKQFIIIHMLKQAIPYSIIAKVLSVSERDVNSCMKRLKVEYSDQKLIEQVLSNKEFSIFTIEVKNFIKKDKGLRLFSAKNITYQELLEYRDKSNELVESFNKIIAEVDRLKSYPLSDEKLRDLYLKRKLTQYTFDKTDKNGTTLICTKRKKLDIK